MLKKMEDDGLLSIKELQSWADLNHVKNKESSYVVSVWNEKCRLQDKKKSEAITALLSHCAIFSPISTLSLQPRPHCWQWK